MGLDIIKHEKATEFLERPPSWLTKWGIYIFLFLFASFLLFATVFKVTEKLKFNGIIKSAPHDLLISSPKDGWYTMVLKNRDQIKINQVIAYFNEGYSYATFKEFKSYVRGITDTKIVKLQQFTNLGELQQYYDDFLLYSYHNSDTKDALIKLKWSIMYNSLISKIDKFERENIIYSPSNGVLSLNVNQKLFFSSKSETIGQIISINYNPLINFQISIDEFSRIALKQKVMIKLKTIPGASRNSFSGYISFIDWKPIDGKYNVEVCLDRGDPLNSFKKIQFYPNMIFDIEIIKNNETLLTKLINKAKML